MGDHCCHTGESKTGGIPLLSPKEVLAKSALVKLIDVRRPDEFVGELGHIGGSVLATLETDFEAYLQKLSKDEAYVFICRSGGRSARATEMAQANGFKKVFNMTGGMLAWNQEGLPIEK